MSDVEETQIPQKKVPEKDVQVKCCDGVIITIKPQVGKYLKTICELWEMPNPIIETHFSSRLMADLNDAVACEDLEALITQDSIKRPIITNTVESRAKRMNSKNLRTVAQ